jgi:hypothetical protein
MTTYPRVVTAIASGFTVAMLCAGPVPALGQTTTTSTIRDAATGKLQPPQLPSLTGSKTAPFISSGTLVTAIEALTLGAADDRQEAADANSPDDLGAPNLGINPGTLGCSRRNAGESGTRVNQDCTFRRQAEEMIAVNPMRSGNLLAGQNDSRVGFNQCGIDFSRDNGEHWGDLLPPFRQRLNNPASETPTTGDPNSHTIHGAPGTNHTYDAASDPGPAFDSAGRGFFSCVAFDINSNASLLYVVASPLGADGSFFFNIATAGRNYIVVEDNDPTVFHDKPFITADVYAGSPNRDNVYATWTVFNLTPTGGYRSSPIYGSVSTDHGRTWSTPEEISGRSSTLCFFGNFFDPTRNMNDCDFDQGSDPVVLPNGDLAVVFNNGNTASNNPNGQQLAVHCSPSGSSPAGTAHLNCGTPAKVGDDVIVNEPLCNFGRGPEECVPGPYIRTNDFPRIGVNRANGHLFAAWQDYRNQEYDVQVSESTDGGATWSLSKTVNPDTALDHYMPAVDVVRSSSQDHVAVSYYRSARVPNENSSTTKAPPQPGVQAEPSDYVLAGGENVTAPFHFNVVSPVFAPPDGNQAGFNGDYSGLAIDLSAQAHPIWSDTRNADPYTPANGLVHDEDVFSLTANVPDGVATASVGQIGHN